MQIRMTFARACRETRTRLDISQAELAVQVGVSRGYIANLEAGRANPSMAQVDRIAEALGLELALTANPPTFLGERRPHDLVHARCSTYSGRRLEALNWQIAREVKVTDGRLHGWIDLLAFDPRTGTLLIIEIKTRLEDLGGLERQIGWYERLAREAAIEMGWQPTRIVTWLVTLASEEIDHVLQANRDLIDRDFPGRADHMLAVVRDGVIPLARAVAMVDPSSRRKDWLIRARIDGRRSATPYVGYADAARRL